MDTSAPAPTTGDTHKGVNAPGLQVFVFALFFIFGGITSLNDVIIPKLKELFTLNYTQAMLVQFCFFTAYALIGIPGAMLVKRIGYMGYDGKSLIHPRQIDICNAAFGPDAAEIEWAMRVRDAFASSDGGVIQVDGKMVEALHLIQAERILGMVS